jgi:hypothetical protein
VILVECDHVATLDLLAAAGGQIRAAHYCWMWSSWRRYYNTVDLLIAVESNYFVILDLLISAECDHVIISQPLITAKNLYMTKLDQLFTIECDHVITLQLLTAEYCCQFG